MPHAPPPSNEFRFVLEPRRPLKKFGKKFALELSTGLGFSPDTIMRAASGLGWNQNLEKMAYREYRALLAWISSQERGSKMQRASRRDLEKAFNPFEGNGAPLTPEGLARLPNSISSPWRLLFRTLRRQFSPLHRKLLVRLALYDRFAHQITDSRSEEERLQRRRQAFLPSLEYWKSTGFELTWQSSVALDMMLQHLAWLDVELSSKNSTLWPVGYVVRLAEPSKLPMRHWFDTLLVETKQANLVELCAYLARRGVLSRNRVISYDQLKDWASTEELIPHHAVSAILEGCKGEVTYNQQQHCLWFARLLTFSVELICSFSAEPIDKKTAQKAVHERLLQLCAGFRAA